MHERMRAKPTVMHMTEFEIVAQVDANSRLAIDQPKSSNAFDLPGGLAFGVCVVAMR
jgi:hypothetical protein